MHEWALSDSVAKAAAQIKQEQNFKYISSVTVVLGEVQDIAAKVFKDIFDEVKLQHPGVERAELQIETENGKFKCNNCGTLFSFERERLNQETAEDIHFVPETLRLFLLCPKCKSKDFSILEGRGLYIKSIEGEK